MLLANVQFVVDLIKNHINSGARLVAINNQSDQINHKQQK